MVPDTGYLKYFSLHLYDEGFVIQMPVKEQPEKIPEFITSPAGNPVLRAVLNSGISHKKEIYE